jgi:serine/threonine protein phosphatase PrpC
MWSVITKSVKGPSHSENQDAVAFQIGEGHGSLVVLAVSDGHGSPKCFRSSAGSKFAVEAATEVTRKFIDGSQSSSASDIKSKAERCLTTDLVQRWKEKVKEHFDRQPIRDDELERLELTAGPSARKAIQDEVKQTTAKTGDSDNRLKAHYLAYGATLLVVAIGQTFVFYLQLGDGDILAVSENREIEHPLSPDETLLANETTSLCMGSAQNLFRFRFQSTENGAPALILASTDGYSNSFSTPGDFDKVGSDLLEFIQRERDGWMRVQRELPAWLHEASETGSGDDVTLGMICRKDVIGNDSNKPAAQDLKRLINDSGDSTITTSTDQARGDKR